MVIFLYIRLLSKLHLFAEMILFGIFIVKFFNHMYTYAFKICQSICSKIIHFYKQSKFRKKSILSCICLWIGMLDAAPYIDASIDSTKAYAHFPLEGTITITHSQDEKIDLNSFKMEDKALEVSLIKEAKMSGKTIVTIFSFQLPAKDKGLHVLPSISVTINDKLFQSTPSSFQVKAGAPTPTQPIVPSLEKEQAPIIFKLEAFVNGPQLLHPGQRTQLVYRISYNRSVDLTQSLLPMVRPAHFQKIGDVQIKDYQEGDVTFQEITQVIEATDVGKFPLGPSSIEGYAYTIKAGQKIYESLLLKAEVPPITIEVKSFPSLNQPASFTGALGQIRAETVLESPSSVFVGDNIKLGIKISGIDNLSESRLPVLECQPGFSGFFQMSDLPPSAEIEKNMKIFHIEMRPLTTLMNQIPSIELSSFDPSAEKYVIVHTEPLALEVKATSERAPMSEPKSIIVRLPPVGQWPTPYLSPLEITGRRLELDDLKMSWLNSSRVLWLIPFGIIFLFLQKRLHDQWFIRHKPKISKGEELLQKAFKTDSLQSLESLHILEQAIWQRLWEKKIVPRGVYQLDNLPQEKESVRSFLFLLSALQYSEEKAFDSLKLKTEAQYAFKSI